MGRIGWLVWKDVRLFLADRGGVLLTVVTPILLAILFSVLFRPPDAGRLDLLVVDEDGGAAARELVATLRADPTVHVDEVTGEIARDRLRRGAAPVALVVPAGAGRLLGLAGLAAPADAPGLRLLHDPSRPYEAELARGSITRAVARLLGAGLARRDDVVALLSAVRATNPTPAVARLLDAAEAVTTEGAQLGLLARLRDPTALTVEVAGDRGIAQGFSQWTHNFVGMLTMFLLFLALERAKGLLDERQRGTALRLRLAAPTRALLLGAALSTALLALAVSAVVLSVGALGFGLEVRGSRLGFAALLVAQAVTVAGFSLLLAGLGRTSVQITTLGTLAVLVMSFLGGATMPTFLMPAWVQDAAVVVPTTWATQGLAAVTWRGLGLEAALGPAAALVAFGLAFGLLGARRFRWEGA